LKARLTILRPGRLEAQPTLFKVKMLKRELAQLVDA
jgi:hypothetical protein